MNKADAGAEKIKVLVVTKRQYTGKDLLDDRFGRIRELSLQLGLRGFRVNGVCLSYQKKSEGKTLDGPVIWESVNAGPLKIRGLLRFILYCSSLASHADVIWACSDSFYGIIGYWLSRRCHTPLIFDLYDNFEYFLAAKMPGIKQLYRRVVRKSDAVTCVSYPLDRLVRSYGRTGPVFVLENAVPKRLFRSMDKNHCRAILGLPHTGRIVGTAGALETNRGVPLLLQGFATVKARHPDLLLALAGPRHITIPQEEGIYDLGVLPYAKVPLFFNALDVAVVCNRENDFGKYCFPQKAREIMSCRIPMVAADVGSMTQLLTGHSEWLYDPNDAGSLAKAISDRLYDQRTEYGDIPDWSDLGAQLEKIILETRFQL
jgi:teichuronic acid biosynthesis glycosyltransferase TuaC